MQFMLYDSSACGMENDLDMVKDEGKKAIMKLLQ